MAGLLEGLKGIKDQITGAREKAPVLLEDVKVGTWRNKKREGLVIRSLDPLAVEAYSVQDPKNKPHIFENLEALRKALEEGEYTFVVTPGAGSDTHDDTQPSDTESDTVPGHPEPATVPRPRAVVVPPEIVRVKTGEVPVSEDLASENAFRVEYEAIGQEIFSLHAKLLPRLTEIATRLQADQENQVLNPFRERGKALLGKLTTLLVEQTRFQTRQLKKSGLNQEDMTLCRARLNALREIEVKIDELDADIMAALVAKPADIPKPDAPKGGDPVALLAEVKVRQALVEQVMTATQQEVEGIIQAIQTPEDYARFYQSMAEVPTSKPNQLPLRYIVSLKKIKQALNGEMSSDERARIDELEKVLQIKARDRFFTLKNNDLRQQLGSASLLIRATPSEAALDTLVAMWKQEPPLKNIWSAVMDQLSEVDQNIIRAGYESRTARLFGFIETQRQWLRVKPALEAFLAKGAGAQEKVRNFQAILDREFRAFDVDLEERAKQAGKTIPPERREALWEEQGGEACFEGIIVRHFESVDGIDPVEGKKIFQAIVMQSKDERKKRNK